jgi:hypothetical protein
MSPPRPGTPGCIAWALAPTRSRKLASLSLDRRADNALFLRRPRIARGARNTIAFSERLRQVDRVPGGRLGSQPSGRDGPLWSLEPPLIAMDPVAVPDARPTYGFVSGIGPRRLPPRPCADLDQRAHCHCPLPDRAQRRTRAHTALQARNDALGGPHSHGDSLLRHTRGRARSDKISHEYLQAAVGRERPAPARVPAGALPRQQIKIPRQNGRARVQGRHRRCAEWFAIMRTPTGRHAHEPFGPPLWEATSSAQDLAADPLLQWLRPSSSISAVPGSQPQPGRRSAGPGHPRNAENTPTATHNHSVSRSTRRRQPLLRRHSRHLTRLDFSYTSTIR